MGWSIPTILIMELVAGETLAERVKRDGAFPIEEALKIGVQIAEARRRWKPAGTYAGSLFSMRSCRSSVARTNGLFEISWSRIGAANGTLDSPKRNLGNDLSLNLSCLQSRCSAN